MPHIVEILLALELTISINEERVTEEAKKHVNLVFATPER